MSPSDGPAEASSESAITWLKSIGPAVILGNPQSLFVTQLARCWLRFGLDVHIVTTGPDLAPASAAGLSVIDSRSRRPTWTRLARLVNPLLRKSETLLPRLYRRRYRLRTGQPEPRRWELFWVDHYWDSFSRAQVAMELKPSFVFAQEAAAYGLAAARCTQTTRVVFPWGADIYVSCEASPIINAMIRRAFRRAHLIVPSSVAAKDRICSRFGVEPHKVEPISWGVDLDLFRPLTDPENTTIRDELAIPQNAVVVMNARRFDPLWGSDDVLRAMLELARRRTELYCILLGGGYEAAHLRNARRQVQDAGLEPRFRFFPETVSIEQYAQLVGTADVALSLMSRGDMRSSSVLQSAAAGAVPVISDTSEHRLMQDAGFACRLVPSGDVDGLLAHIDELLATPALRSEMAEANRHYLEIHEDHDAQMRRLLLAIAGTVRQQTGG